jgi:large subunit ribosomal protein L6
MSRVGKSPVKISQGVKININGQSVNVEGPKGKLAYTFHENIKIEKKDDVVVLTRSSDSKTDKALHGTSRALLNNMVTGVTTGFKKELEIRGVGYRGEQKGKNVSLLLGYSHPIEFHPPAGVSVKVEGNVKLIVEGIDRQVVGQVAATIRGFKPPEPYKGKGVRYSDEVVVQKEVKKT